jgi:hypothetical protein
MTRGYTTDELFVKRRQVAVLWLCGRAQWERLSPDDVTNAAKIAGSTTLGRKDPRFGICRRSAARRAGRTRLVTGPIAARARSMTAPGTPWVTGSLTTAKTRQIEAARELGFVSRQAVPDDRAMMGRRSSPDRPAPGEMRARRGHGGPALRISGRSCSVYHHRGRRQGCQAPRPRGSRRGPAPAVTVRDPQGCSGPGPPA